MPSVFVIMSYELAEIAWQDELDARADHLRDEEKRVARERRRGKTPTPITPIVYDANKAEALDSLACEVQEDYAQWMFSRRRGEQDTTRTRKRLPKWMTWPMLLEWSQRYRRAMRVVRANAEAEEAQDRPARSPGTTPPATTRHARVPAVVASSCPTPGPAPCPAS